MKNICFIQKSTTLDYEQADVSHIDGNHKLKVTSASASSSVNGKGIEKSYDNNDITFFQSDWQPMLPVFKPVELVYNFTDERSIHYLLYTPNKLDTKKIFSDTEIWIKCKGDADYSLVKSHTFAGDYTQKIEFDKRIENPVSIKFVVKTVSDVSEQTYLCAACAEMRFYSTDLQYSDIFTDKSYSSLKQGITIDDVFKIDDEFFRNIAEYLFYKKYPKIRIQKYEPYPTPVAVHAMKPYGLLDNVTGISVKKDEDLIVMVDNLNGQVINLTLLDANGDYVKADYLIDEGVSKFKMVADGLLYVSHFATQSATIHIAGGYVNGYYNSQKNTESEGRAYLDKATGKYFDLLGKYVHLIFPTEALKVNTTSLKALVDKYDEIVSLHYKFNGVEKTNVYQKNRICIKSTLIEAIAINAGFNAEGGSKNFNFTTNQTHSTLFENIKIVRSYNHNKDGYFLRAESYYNVASELEEIEKSAPIPYKYYGGKSLHKQSHGESFMSLLRHRLSGNGLYIFDEPEAALSPSSQLEMMCRINDLVKRNSQFIIATHSPILMAYPDADIYQITANGFELVDYRQTEHYAITKSFMDNPERMLNILLNDDL